MIHRWTQTWKSLVLTFPDHIRPGLLLPNQYRNQATDHLFELLCTAYSEKPRKYHTMQHITECFKFYDSLPNISGKSARTEMALWFHDIIIEYDTWPIYSNSTNINNEEESAMWCKYLLVEVGISEELSGQISNLIPATNHKTILTNPENQLLADVDLFILGSPQDRFDEYERQIREELLDVPDDIFYQTRGNIMNRFLGRKYIYYTPEIRKLLEDRAKENLSKYNISKYNII